MVFNLIFSQSDIKESSILLTQRNKPIIII